MYTVVEIAGFQYQVKPGDLLDVQLLDAEIGKDLSFDKVLFVGGENPAVGTPTVAGAKVTVRVLKHGKGEKILVFKRKPGRYQKRKGHRQNYTALIVTEVVDAKGKVHKIDPKNELATKHLK